MKELNRQSYNRRKETRCQTLHPIVAAVHVVFDVCVLPKSSLALLTNNSYSAPAIPYRIIIHEYGIVKYSSLDRLPYI